MNNIDALKSRIEELRSIDFDFKEIKFYENQVYATNVLRVIQICLTMARGLSNKSEREELTNLVCNVVYEKFRKLEPDLSDEILDKICDYCYRGMVRYPIDLFIVDDTLFVKELEIDDFGRFYKKEILNFGIDYNQILGDTFSFMKREHKTYEEELAKRLYRKEIHMKYCDFMSDRINEVTCSILGNEIIKPRYLENNCNCFGFTYADNSHAMVYLNEKYNKILDNFTDEIPCDIKMIIRNNEDFWIYIFHQKFQNDEAIWDAEKIDAKIWKLSDAVMKSSA